MVYIAMGNHVGRHFALLLLLSLIIKVAVPQLCSVQDEELLKRRRVQGLRAHILAQLGMKEPLPIMNATTPKPEILEAYKALTEATEAREREREKCQSDEFLNFAQPVNSFVGTIVPVPISSEDYSGGSVDKRSTSEVQKPSNALAIFNLTFNFSLENDLKVVTKAELLLFQVPLTKDDYITAKEQYVEIKVVYEALGVKSVIVGKHVKVFDSGFQDFDITSAIQNWISKGLEGPLKLEVTIYCFSPSCTSPDSEGRDPKYVCFLSDFKGKKHAPRIVVTSQNPLEKDQHRSKRQTQVVGPFCVNNQSVCCLKPLRINFVRDLGFRFVTEPPDYEANYCEGVCPIAPNGELKTPRLFEFLSRLEGSPASSVEPCCAGNAYKDLNIMVQMPMGTHMLLTLRQVRVTSCRCA